MDIILNIMDIEVGTRLRLVDGSDVETMYNPQDGVWLFCCYLASEALPHKVDGKQYEIFAKDIREILG